MRKDRTAIALNQHWGRTGNIVPYFSPAVPALTCLASAGRLLGKEPHPLPSRSRFFDGIWYVIWKSRSSFSHAIFVGLESASGSQSNGRFVYCSDGLAP
jgi:hypothetical protein